MSRPQPALPQAAGETHMRHDIECLPLSTVPGEPRAVLPSFCSSEVSWVPAVFWRPVFQDAAPQA